MAKLYFISFFILVSTIVSAESEIEDLIVTGSFIKKNSQGPLPLESINNDEYRKLNISNIAEINKYISSSSGSHFQSNNLDGFDQGMSSINLRGLGNSSTLTLINSKRHTFAGTPSSSGDSYIDLNIVPEIALRQIDILKEGATSLYGSDAVAGVVNIKTVNNFKGIKLQAGHKQTTNFNQSDSSFGLLIGSSYRKIDYTFGLSFLDRKPLLSSEIEGIAELAISGLGRSFRLSEADVVSSGIWAGNYLEGQKIPDPNCETNGGILVNAQTCGFNYGNRFNIVNDEDHKKAYINLTYDINSFQSETTFIFANVKVNDNPQSPSYPALPFLSRKIQPGEGGSPFNVPVTWYGRPLGPEFSSPYSPKNIKQYNFNEVLSKEIGKGLNLEISLTLSRHSNDHFRPDIVDSKFLEALDGVFISNNQQEKLYWDIFIPENNSSALIEYITGAEISRKEASLQSIEAIFRTNISGFNLAYGLQINKENLEIKYDEVSEAVFDSDGKIIKTADLFFLGGGINVSKSRKKYAGFFELDHNAEKFNTRLSGRFEKFNTASSFDPKISSKYMITENLFLRLSKGSSFVMPSMAQMFSSEINLGSIRDFDDTSPFIRQAKIGNPNLKSSTSMNTNLGLVHKNDKHVISLDYWDINFKNRIVSESVQALLNSNPYGKSITRNENNDLIGVTATYFNEEDTRISGFDLSYELLDIDLRSYISISAKVNATKLNKFLTPSKEEINTLINRVGSFNYDSHTYSLPKNRINAFLNLKIGQYELGMNARYIDSYKNERAISDLGKNYGYSNKIASFLVFDFSVSSYLELQTGKVDFKLSIVNMFNKSAPKVYDAPDFSFDSRTHDPRGRLIGLDFEYRL